jgi:hypothetical protein
MKVQSDGFEFDFTDAVDAFVFDQKDKTQPPYHGLSHAMKAVDLVVELPNDVLLIEIKDFHAADDYDFKSAIDTAQKAERLTRLNHLRDVLTHKFRDTWLYHWADNKADKPIRYLCLLTLDNGLLPAVLKTLHKQLPVGLAGPRWQRPLLQACVVLNPDRWNSNFPAWPVKRIPMAQGQVAL